ncbi:MAG: carboxymuconolactone decarboxylase family protein [bacterium]|nr:carboxymuconolactone decarboxylase family protein [bacterium]MDE0290697.1 carboxymuconolactone decarboxylase family protein [bacterium]MDE0376916.1 carboxymuconolactone decarboxylase family protein [bacterium]
MARIDLIDGKDGLAPEQAELYDWIIESRGTLVRPFQVLLHAPRPAEHLARLGHVVRFESGLSGADRELAILATGSAHGCQYVWDTHVGIASREGVRPEALAHLDGTPTDLSEREAAIFGAVRELCESSSLSDLTFSRVESELGSGGVAELCVLVGYYTLLGYTMGAFGVCSVPD